MPARLFCCAAHQEYLSAKGWAGIEALVTLTLRNGNDYAVNDIEISCAFTRRVNADRAKCSLVTANRI